MKIRASEIKVADVLNGRIYMAEERIKFLQSES